MVSSIIFIYYFFFFFCTLQGKYQTISHLLFDRSWFVFVVMVLFAEAIGTLQTRAEDIVTEGSSVARHKVEIAAVKYLRTTANFVVTREVLKS